MLKNVNVKNLDYENMIIIDIRSREKYNDNHIPNSLHIDASELILNPEKYLEKEKTYYIYCQKGKTSINVCINIYKQGYNVINIMGGYENWLINRE